MKFFVPYASGAADAERFWRAMHARLADEYGLSTTRRRILALETDCGAIEVGDGTPKHDYEDVVMAILESAYLDRMYFVFTHVHGELEDPPYPMRLDDKWRVVDFD
ncbi:MAG TPA: hypothetical protein VGW34_04915 [Allosphingosinicella sp.]|nr:hypothetical protein [Allosphingosinicella sp.]